MAKTKICTVCGTKYEYCGHCDSNNINNMWKSLYCSENCRDIYDVCGKYVAGKLTKAEAYNILKNLDTNKDIKLNGVRNNVTDITAYGKTIASTPVFKTPESDATELINTEEETVIEEIPTVQEYTKPRRGRRRFTPTEE